jgi:hypothetical protein
MNKHSYPQFSDNIETLNIDFQQLTQGSLDCLLRYDFNIKRLDTFMYNDFLCLENTAVPITFKEALTLFETLRFEC